MRPQNQAARNQLTTELRRNAPVSAADLAGHLRISVPTVLRILRERGDQIVRIGTTKKARYALRRPLRGIAHSIPVYRIDIQGKGHSCGTLELVEPHGSVMDLEIMGWPVDVEHSSGYWDGLPYPLYDMRPQGFLGRSFARQTYRDLALPSNLSDWSDDDIVHALSQRGSDTIGNLIVGDHAYERWLTSVASPEAPPLPESGLAECYADLAVRIMNLGIAGSSAAGEFPKFTASRELPGAAAPHVIVKFSGTEDSGAVKRWSDLLVCEHIALTTLRETTRLPAAHSRILNAQGRTFLEVERFDRHGMFGRSEIVTLASIDAAFLGSAESLWPESIRRLTKIKLANQLLENKVRVLWWYGKLIANSDMHMGNLSFTFTPEPGKQPELRLAPTYDMLPMFYAPLAGGEVPVRTFEPVLPLPKEREAWLMACAAALHFWQQTSTDTRISDAFRKVCGENYQRLNNLVQLV
ncbi:MAG: type II toxin-antitoxin system HipA family toxin YjjJ [Gammaproteobacteria bacterium]|nr:type II toxin-antitoxin system HipA family toxin YjjJ [Gammaproteobacteria bacterium]